MATFAAVAAALGVAAPGADAGDASAVAPADIIVQNDARQRDTRHRRRDQRPDVNVFIAPQTEHWPSHYVPDSYRLEDYDGKPDSATVCRGESGTTLSTADVTCPPGQSPATGGRSWSTSP